MVWRHGCRRAAYRLALLALRSRAGDRADRARGRGIARDTITALVDERLREKEFGILDRLTKHGIQHKYPELSEERSHVGKFYFRPPGGESWCDVILRLRNVIDTITREYRCERVVIVSHQVVVTCFRYFFERLDEQQILDLDRADIIANCSVTSYEFDPGRAGERLAQRVGPLGYLARELPGEIPALMSPTTETKL